MEKMLTVKEASAYLDGKITVGTLNVWRSMKKGPPYIKLGGKVLYPKDKLDEWIKSQN